MEATISGKNIEVLPEVRDYIDRKMEVIRRHLNNIRELKIELTEEKTKSPDNRYVVQVTVNSAGTLLRAEDRAEDVWRAVDKVAETMDQQIERFKGKRFARKGRASPRGKAAETEEPASRIIKTKHFVVRPLTEDQAVDQMELLGHDFFIFLNMSNNRLNVLYRRKDDNYGLIEPDME